MDRELLAPFRSAPAHSGVFLDFDGTLSEIVRLPSDARPVAGASEVLAELARRFAVVAIISGRSAGELLQWLGPDVEIWGVHGAQVAMHGRVVLAERVVPYRSLMAGVLVAARRAVADLEIDGVLVEDKQVVITLHYRAAPDPSVAAGAVERMARELALRHGLVLVPGRASVELRPPIELSKRAVVLERARERELRAVAFVGDDTVDVPAFDALEELRSEGAAVLKVAVASEESPEELIARADVVVEGPSGVLEFLNRLLEEA